MKLAFIEHGRHAKNNLYPSLKFLGQKLAAIATTSEETALKAKEEQGVEFAYSDYKTMLSEQKPDGVIISVDGKVHPQLVIDCLRAGAHVYVEKPLSETLEESERVFEVSNEAGKFAMVGFMKRHSPVYQKINELLPQIGTITSINTTFGCRNFAKDASEYLLQAAIHMVNITTAYAGDFKELHTVSSTVEKNFTILVNALSSKDVPVSLTLLAADSWSKLNEELILTGTNGFIKYNNNSGLQMHLNQYETSSKKRWQLVDEVTVNYDTVSTTGSGGFQQLYQRGFIPALENFIECISTNKRPITNAEDNLVTMQWVEAIFKG